MGDVVAQRAKHRGSGQAQRGRATCKSGSVQACQKPCGNVAKIAFDTRDLAGKEQILPAAVLQCWPQLRWAMYEGITMHLAIAHKAGTRQSRDHAEHPSLCFVGEIRLKADQVIQRCRMIVLAQLHDREGTAPGPRIDQAYRTHRPEGQRLAASFGQDLNRQAALEEPVRSCLDTFLDDRLERSQWNPLRRQ